MATQLRAGADFGALASANSERELNGVRAAPQNKGKVGRFEIPNLREDIAAAIKNVQVGGISDPLRSNEGYQIFRVDERTAANNTATFNENQVREAITIERSPKEREAYLQKLRTEGYVKIAENYRAAVEPLLKITAAEAAKSGTTAPRKNSNKKKP